MGHAAVTTLLSSRSGTVVRGVGDERVELVVVRFGHERVQVQRLE